eukprot:14665359-Alexandrium_andersonii.AAC.1
MLSAPRLAHPQSLLAEDSDPPEESKGDGSDATASDATEADEVVLLLSDVAPSTGLAPRSPNSSAS